jgi:hypothetical protein
MAQMTLNFPNQSRSYDTTRRCVRFWAYDEALEISFFVEEEALRGISPQVARSEAGFLRAFDRHRDRICDAALRAYSRHSRGSYTLTIGHLR